jgi:hypothetical protein
MNTRTEFLHAITYPKQRKSKTPLNLSTALIKFNLDYKTPITNERLFDTLTALMPIGTLVGYNIGSDTYVSGRITKVQVDKRYNAKQELKIRGIIVVDNGDTWTWSNAKKKFLMNGSPTYDLVIEPIGHLDPNF